MCPLAIKLNIDCASRHHHRHVYIRLLWRPLKVEIAFTENPSLSNYLIFTMLLCCSVMCLRVALQISRVNICNACKMPAPHTGGEKSAGQGDFRTQKGNGRVSDVQLWGQVGWARGGTMGWVAP